MSCARLVFPALVLVASGCGGSSSGDAGVVSDAPSDTSSPVDADEPVDAPRDSGTAMSDASSAETTWTIETTTGTFTVAPSATLTPHGTGIRLALSHRDEGTAAIDDELDATLWVDFAADPAPGDYAVEGTSVYAYGGTQGVASAPVESRWSFTPSSGHAPEITGTLVYWGTVRDAAARYAGTVSGTLHLEADGTDGLRGTLHLEIAPAGGELGGTPFFFGATVSDAAFTVAR